MRLSKSVTLKALKDGSYQVGGLILALDGATGAPRSFHLRRPLSGAAAFSEYWNDDFQQGKGGWCSCATVYRSVDEAVGKAALLCLSGRAAE